MMRSAFIKPLTKKCAELALIASKEPNSRAIVEEMNALIQEMLKPMKDKETLTKGEMRNITANLIKSPRLVTLQEMFSDAEKANITNILNTLMTAYKAICAPTPPRHFIFSPHHIQLSADRPVAATALRSPKH